MPFIARVLATSTTTVAMPYITLLYTMKGLLPSVAMYLYAVSPTLLEQTDKKERKQKITNYNYDNTYTVHTSYFCYQEEEEAAPEEAAPAAEEAEPAVEEAPMEAEEAEPETAEPEPKPEEAEPEPQEAEPEPQEAEPEPAESEPASADEVKVEVKDEPAEEVNSC